MTRPLLVAPLAVALLTLASSDPGARVHAQAPKQAAASPKAQDPSQTPQFRGGANFVHVDVYPTANGTAVRDLTQPEFEVLEDGVPQTLSTFERVDMRGARVEAGRYEPNSITESRQIAESTKGRLFVIFLDTYFVDISGSHRLQRTLVNLLNRVLGPDDMYAVMTPDMSAADLTFARRTDVMEVYLSKYWFWGQRDRLYPDDPVERQYMQCYPEDTSGTTTNQYGGVAREMILRRHERKVLGALEDLAVYLRGVREERKAVITLTGGWILFRENANLTRNGHPQPGQIGITPDGRLTDDHDASKSGYSERDCDNDRLKLSMLDDFQYFHDLFDIANRANVSFYPVNANGLVAFDKPLGPGVSGDPVEGEIQALGPAAHVGENGSFPINPMQINTASISTRNENLRTLAANTDGIAIVDTNDLDKGMNRIIDDLTTYYLLGYTSTNSKLDGRYRKITVRVKRPNVQVRARRGYRAPTQEEVEQGRMLEAKQESSGPATALQVALNALGSARPGIPFRTSVSYAALGPADGGGTKLHAWALAELDPSVARQGDWLGGGSVEVRVTGPDGTELTTRTGALNPGDRSAAVDLGEVVAPPGEIVVRARLSPKSEGLPYSDTIRLSEVSAPGRPLILRRGPTTGVRYVPTADLQFQRTERVRVDLPTSAGAAPPVAEVLDRMGKTIQVPVRTSVRTENGLTWASAEVTLAPLAPGDYLVRLKSEAGSAGQEVVTGFRVVP